MFSMKARNHHFVAAELSALAPVLTDIVNKWSRNPLVKAGTPSELRAVEVLRKLRVCAKKLKGSAGYMLCRWNEIRSLIHQFSTPALFITLNPHDLSSALLGSLGGLTKDQWRSMSAYDRVVFVAKHLDAAARAFDLQIQVFLDIIVRFRKNG